jgi:hypothetical protein
MENGARAVMLLALILGLTLSADASHVLLGASLDLGSTEWSLNRCPGCRDIILPNRTERLAVMAGDSIFAIAGTKYLRAHKHPGLATGASWLFLSFHGGAAILHTIHGLRRR